MTTPRDARGRFVRACAVCCAHPCKCATCVACGAHFEKGAATDTLCYWCGEGLMPPSGVARREVDYVDAPASDKANLALLRCAHGNVGECEACNIAGDFAYDAARERAVFGK